MKGQIEILKTHLVECLTPQCPHFFQMDATSTDTVARHMEQAGWTRKSHKTSGYTMMLGWNCPVCSLTRKPQDMQATAERGQILQLSDYETACVKDGCESKFRMKATTASEVAASMSVNGWNRLVVSEGRREAFLGWICHACQHPEHAKEEAAPAKEDKKPAREKAKALDT